MKSLISLTILLAASAARADTPEPVPSVAVPTVAPPMRSLVLELDPLPFIGSLGRLGGEIVFAPIEHHALVIAPFYTSTRTAPIFVFDAAGNAMQLPQQIFRGVGVELGYRYYRGRGGPRGLFIGPSLVLVEMFEKQGQYGDGSSTNFTDIGVAVDLGYQALIADRVAIALGAGVQGLVTSQTIPDQQFPAKLYANSGISPRFLFSIGWAF